jgi:hypothetical protein
LVQSRVKVPKIGCCACVKGVLDAVASRLNVVYKNAMVLKKKTEKKRNIRSADCDLSLRCGTSSEIAQWIDNLNWWIHLPCGTE